MSAERILTQEEIWALIDARGERERLAKAMRDAGQPRTDAFGRRVGHYTGRCGNCGSDDLWDDQSAYGCNRCEASWFFG